MGSASSAAGSLIISPHDGGWHLSSKHGVRPLGVLGWVHVAFALFSLRRQNKKGGTLLSAGSVGPCSSPCSSP